MSMSPGNIKPMQVGKMGGQMGGQMGNPVTPAMRPQPGNTQDTSAWLNKSIGAYQQATALEKANPDFASRNTFFNPSTRQSPFTRDTSVFGSLSQTPTGYAPSNSLSIASRLYTPQQRQDAASYLNAMGQARELTPFANWYGQNVAGTRNPTQLNQIHSQVLNDIGAGNTAPYAGSFEPYAQWRAADVERSNANGMLSGGLGGMIPGLALGALPLAGLSSMAAGALFGGARGGPMGAIRGGAPGPMSIANRFR
jgi:hypothetical protein